MRKIHIIFTFILFSCFLQSQIKLENNAIDSIIVENSSKCFDFHLDEKNSYVSFEELTKDESSVPAKLKVSLSDVSNLNKIMNSSMEYDYLVVYDYKFTINGSVFYDIFFRYGTSQYDASSIKIEVDNANSICSKIKKGKFISPQEAEKIAKQKGFQNINFQSIDDHYFGLKQGFIKSIEKDVWIFKEEKNERIRTLVTNARNGKVLTDYKQ